MEMPSNFKELPLEERRELIRQKHADVSKWGLILFVPFALLMNKGPTRFYYVWALVIGFICLAAGLALG